MRGPERRELARTAAFTTDGVTSRDALLALGLTHVDVRTEVAAGRWRCHGLQTVALHCGPIGVDARRWQAIWETGAGVAALDGVTALQVAGLRNYVDEEVHVSVIHTASVKHLPGVRLHKVIRRLPDELSSSGPPRTRPAVAALRAASWAVSDRQAALILLMTVQQRLATPRQMLELSARMPGRRRRGFVRRILFDAADGVQSLGELDFARMCRSRGLPEPSRQVVRRGPRGRIYLDVRWEDSRLVVEIDGAQHREGLNVTADNLSRNAVTLQHDRVLRIDLVGLRLYEDEYLRQVALGLAQ
jgi:very-short-patch-repair endonuclease